MTNPLTHLLWGYAISKNISDEKKFIILGLVMSVLPDIDWLPLPGLKHHGFIHTPFFIVILCILIYPITKSRIISLICLINLLYHLILDTIGTRAPVMWLYPLSYDGFALWSGLSFTGLDLIILISVKLILFSIPVVYILFCYYYRGENPFKLIEFMRNKLGDKLTYFLIIVFIILLVYIGVTEYLIKTI